MENSSLAKDGSSADDKVVSLAVYKIKRSLKNQGFDLITDQDGKLTLVLRVPRK